MVCAALATGGVRWIFSGRRRPLCDSTVRSGLMQRIKLEYREHRCGSVSMLACGILTALLSAANYVGVTRELAAMRPRVDPERQQEASRSASIQYAPRPIDRNLVDADRIADSLSVPWNALLTAIETAAIDDIA